ncbi:hypothetical protein [Bacillus sp. AK031]
MSAMSKWENQYEYPRKRDDRRTITSLWEEMNSRRHPYPSSFYQDNEELEHTPEPRKRVPKKENHVAPPLILSPPPVTAKKVERKNEKKEEFIPKRKKEEIIPVPDESIDEFLVEKELSDNEDWKPAETEWELAEEDSYEVDSYEEEKDESEESPDEELQYEEDKDGLEEEKEEEEKNKDDVCENPIPSKKLLAKLPVLIFKEKLEIDIFDSFNIMIPLCEITNMSWRIRSFKGHAVLPSKTVFVKLVLVADMDFVSEDGTLQSLQIEVPLERNFETNWLTDPELSFNDSREYWFRSKTDHHISVHRAFEETLVSPVTFKYNSFDVIWHQEVIEKPDGELRLGLKGSAKLTIEGYQDQVVEIEI